MNIFLIGPMAAGKSHIGKTLAKRLKSRFYDTDALICQHAGVDIPTIFKQEGESGFRKRETQVVQEIVGNHNIVVATGGGVVLDKQNCKNIKENGTVIYLNTSLDTRYERMQDPAERPLLAEGDAYKVMQDLDRVRIPIYEALADFVVDNDGNVELTVAKIVECIDRAEEV